MAIRGGLAEFSVPELLQLLALQQKTGVLTLTHKKGETHVLFFWRGRVLAAADRRRSSRHQFLTYLFQNQLITEDQMESVEDISRSTAQDIFTVVLASGVMGRDRLQEEMHSFTQRLADGLMDWVDGTYDFTPCEEKSLPSQGVPMTVNPEELVLESMRRTDELATMKESMLSPDLVLAVVESAPKEPLPRETALVLRLVDGSRSIQEICRRSPLGEFLTYEAVSDLLSRQRIMILDPKEAKRFQTPRKPATRFSLPVLAGVLAMVFGSALLGSGLHPLLGHSRGTGSWLDEGTDNRRTTIQKAVARDVDKLIENTRPR